MKARIWITAAVTPWMIPGFRKKNFANRIHLTFQIASTRPLSRRQAGSRLGRSVAAFEDFRIRKHPVRSFRARENALDQSVCHRNLVALKPEMHVRLATHGANLNYLLHPKKMRGHA